MSIKIEQEMVEEWFNRHGFTRQVDLGFDDMHFIVFTRGNVRVSVHRIFNMLYFHAGYIGQDHIYNYIPVSSERLEETIRALENNNDIQA